MLNTVDAENHITSQNDVARQDDLQRHVSVASVLQPADAVEVLDETHQPSDLADNICVCDQQDAQQVLTPINKDMCGCNKERADAVMAYLVSKGVDSKRMWAKGYGNDREVRDCNDRSCKVQNRRVVANLRTTPDAP